MFKVFKRSLTTFNKKYFIHPYKPHHSLVSLSKLPDNVPLGVLSHQDLTTDEIMSQNDFSVELTNKNFRENSIFFDVLSKFLSANIHEDFTYIMEAGQFPDSFMPIYDFRKIPEYGRISDTDDIFGWVRVDSKGEINPKTFSANDMYRIFSQKNGLPVLSDYLMENIDTLTKIE